MAKVTRPRTTLELLRIRENLIEAFHKGIVTESGLISQGRAEVFDYLLNGETKDFALKAIEAAAAALCLAQFPVISVNGNVTALVADKIAELCKLIGCKVEVSLFYRTKKRIEAVYEHLKNAGINDPLVPSFENSEVLEGIPHTRKFIHKDGIGKADVVLVPMEDGDRTIALAKLKKVVIAIDLNPLSRTAQNATITIVDNIVRCLPKLIEKVKEFKNKDKDELRRILANYNNSSVLNDAVQTLLKNMELFSQIKAEVNVEGDSSVVRPLDNL